MKLVFEKADIDALLIARAAALGIKANKVEWDNNYGFIRGATASYVADEVMRPKIDPLAGIDLTASEGVFDGSKT